jgi:hypothetical protein
MYVHDSYAAPRGAGAERHEPPRTQRAAGCDTQSRTRRDIRPHPAPYLPQTSVLMSHDGGTPTARS